MSTLKADTIQNTSGGAATLTKQEAVKHYVNYNARPSTQATETSLNQSSLTDQSTGVFYSSFTNNFSDAHDKVHFVSNANIDNPASAGAVAGATRAGSTANVGSTASATGRAHATSEVQFFGAYGSTGGANGAAHDFGANYCCTIGDLA